jgi:hypothetical protein
LSSAMNSRLPSYPAAPTPCPSARPAGSLPDAKRPRRQGARCSILNFIYSRIGRARAARAGGVKRTPAMISSINRLSSSFRCKVEDRGHARQIGRLGAHARQVGRRASSPRSIARLISLPPGYPVTISENDSAPRPLAPVTTSRVRASSIDLTSERRGRSDPLRFAADGLHGGEIVGDHASLAATSAR